MKAYGVPRTFDAEYLWYAPKTSVRRSDGRSSQRSTSKARIRTRLKKSARHAAKEEIRQTETK